VIDDPPNARENTEEVATMPASMPVIDPAIAYQNAMELLAEARRTDRSSSERIADYERAIATLSRLNENIHGQRPAEFAEVVLVAQRELDKLKLEAYFP